MPYRTVKDSCLINVYSKYGKKLAYMTDEEVNEIFQNELRKFNNDFKSFYARVADITAKIAIEGSVPILVLEAKNVLGVCCLYRSIEDIWDFYDPDEDVYEDGFLRIWEDNKGVHILDAFSKNQLKVLKS